MEHLTWKTLVWARCEPAGSDLARCLPSFMHCFNSHLSSLLRYHSVYKCKGMLLLNNSQLYWEIMQYIYGFMDSYFLRVEEFLRVSYSKFHCRARIPCSTKPKPRPSDERKPSSTAVGTLIHLWSSKLLQVPPGLQFCQRHLGTMGTLYCNTKNISECRASLRLGAATVDTSSEN